MLTTGDSKGEGIISEVGVLRKMIPGNFSNNHVSRRI